MRIKGSVYVLVLILLGLSVLFVIIVYRALTLGQLQYGLERETTKLEKLLISALDTLTKEYTDNPQTLLNNPLGYVTLNELGICGESTIYDLEKRCDDDSKIYIRAFNQIISYNMQNGESLQPILAELGSPPVSGSRASIEVHVTPNRGGDALLIVSYYESGNTYKVGGGCVVRYTNDGSSVLNTECVGALRATVLPVDPNQADIYGQTRVRISSVGAPVSFYRIKLLTRGLNAVPVSITGVDYGQLPQIQQVVLIGEIYSPADNENKVKVFFSRAISAQPNLPELFDWALYNGSNESILK